MTTAAGRSWDDTSPMGVFMTVCKCGCQKKVQRGSNYFLQQHLGLDAGLELIEKLNSEQFIEFQEVIRRTGAGGLIWRFALPDVVNEVRDQSKQLRDAAHTGPHALLVKRSEIEDTNRLICMLALWMQLAHAELYRLSGFDNRMSPAQRRIYLSLLRGANQA
jgi:hypothetical protein